MEAAVSANRHVLALEGDSSIFEEVLRPLQMRAPLPQVIPRILLDDDDDEPIPDEDKVDLCE